MAVSGPRFGSRGCVCGAEYLAAGMRAVSKEQNPRFVWAVVTLYFVYLLSVDMTAIAVDCGARLTREAGMGSAVLERISVLLHFSNVMPGLQTL